MFFPSAPSSDAAQEPPTLVPGAPPTHDTPPSDPTDKPPQAEGDKQTEKDEEEAMDTTGELSSLSCDDDYDFLLHKSSFSFLLPLPSWGPVF